MEENMMIFSDAESGDAVVRKYSGLALAYIGDSIFDLLIKDYFVRRSNMSTEKYHKVVSGIVKAVNQAALIDEMSEEGVLTGTESDVYRRGRNSAIHTKAKNATMGEYKKATGFEAVLGYLYLKGDMDRLRYFADRALEKAGFSKNEI